MTSLGFELCLLDLMSERYRAEVLSTPNFDMQEVAAAKASCSLRLPGDMNSSLASYTAQIGEPARAVKLPDDAVPPAFVGSTAHCFTLMLWPHLYWVVHTKPEPVDAGHPVWGVGFQNQVEPAFRDFDPRTIRPGVWTRDALFRFADQYHVYDGWEESVEWQVDFGSVRYRASFVCGLLQEWRVDRQLPSESDAIRLLASRAGLRRTRDS